MPIRFLPLLMLLFAAKLAAAPQAELWPRWTAQDPQSNLALDHGTWDALLRRYVRAADDGVNRFAYGEVGEADRQRLDNYVDQLARTSIGRYRREAQFAYWVNLYNALTVREILRHYPIESIRRISSGLFSPGPWGRQLVTVEGETLTLDDIEHRILRPIWRDPRIHYAVNCASIGCPNLQPRAFTAANSEALLELGAREFVNHRRGAAVVGGELFVSSIYVWFQADFGGDDSGVIAHLKRYAEADLARGLATVSEIEDDDYDWSLNDAGD